MDNVAVKVVFLGAVASVIGAIWYRKKTIKNVVGSKSPKLRRKRRFWIKKSCTCCTEDDVFVPKSMYENSNIEDIRSFFSVISKRSASSSSSTSTKIPPKHKNHAIIIDSDDDLIEETPTKKKVSQKKITLSLSSDSEEEQLKCKKEKSPLKRQKTDSKEKKSNLKPVNINQLFSNTTVKTTKVEYVPNKETEKTKSTDKKEKKSKKDKNKNPELGVHNDKAFEKTLLALDEDDDTILLENMDLLDKTMEEAEKLINKGHNEDHNTPIKGDKKRQREDVHGAKSTPSRKKQKLEHVDSGIDNDQERWEKRRHSAVLYQKYLHRGGPKHRGEKEIPQGKPNCLENLTFLRTGVLDSLESDEFESLIKSHGGKAVHGVSKKVNYVVVGDDPGPAKLEKARNYNIKEINEDELFDLILTKSDMKPKYSTKIQSEDQGIASGENSPEQIKNTVKKIISEKIIKGKDSPIKKDTVKKRDSPKKKESDKQIEKNLNKFESIKQDKEEIKKDENRQKFDENLFQEIEMKKQSISTQQQTEKIHQIEEKEQKNAESTQKNVESKKEPEKSDKVKKDKKSPSKTESSISKKDIPSNGNVTPLNNKAWTEKYRPTTLKLIIGQQDSSSNMNKLRTWLKNWNRNRNPEVQKKLPRPTPWNQFDGAMLKAALLSGPPGVGKTTTATLVAQDLGYDIVEFNASDTRSKKMLHEEISHMMHQKSVSAYAQGQFNLDQKRVLLMDEVDGMAGNEDRGGIAELINLIKISNFPIICMCNDRNHQKMRTLVTHCYGLKFNKPPLNQIRGAMMSICFKEGLKIKPEALSELINGTGCDIRQTLNNLAMWSAVDKNLTDATVKTEAAKAHKDVVFGPWDVVRKVFSYRDNQSMSIQDKARLFFYDYSLGPLFVQENYLRVKPKLNRKKLPAKKEILLRMCLTAESLSVSDQIESKIRTTNNWSLLDSQAYFSTVMPSLYMSGEIVKGIEFPGWFGKNSRQTKTKRLLSELHSHIRTRASGDKISIRTDYCIPLRNAIVQPLIQHGKDGIRQSLDVMKTYCLLREDLTNLVELCQGFKTHDIFLEVDFRVKSAFTRAYNKDVLLPFAPPTASKKKRTAVDDESRFGDDDIDVQDDDEENDDNLENDGMIKVKAVKETENTSEKAGPSKENSKKKSSKSGATKRKLKAKKESLKGD